MSYSSRVYRHRNAHTHENDSDNEKASFFSKADKQSATGKTHKPFFQAKLNVNQPGDKYEKEADSVANTVVNSKSDKPAVEEEKITGVQRLASSNEEEKLGTNEERMKRDKDIQTKPEVQRKCDECEKEEKGKGMVQKMDIGEKDKKQQETNAVQRKENGGGAEAGGNTASPNLSSRISNAAGRGRAMSRKTMGEMQSSFGADFSKVRIHTDAESADMNQRLNAQAFTHGNDIYFNTGKFNPDTVSGKLLLAHELTHVLQQQGYEEKSEGPNVQKLGALAIGAAIAAAVTCAYAFYSYALDNYSHKGDKWMHCWVSCKITTWCGGSPAFSLLVGAGKEAVDAVADSLGYAFHAEFADFVADMAGTVACLFRTCEGCCDDYYS
jgi:hypothetical protein